MMRDEHNYRKNGRAGDDPQAAFEQVRGEVALGRLEVEGLARARESIEIPDYQPTLANTEKILVALTQRVDVIANSHALLRTPETLGERVNASEASATGAVGRASGGGRVCHVVSLPWVAVDIKQTHRPSQNMVRNY